MAALKGDVMLVNDIKVGGILQGADESQPLCGLTLDEPNEHGSPITNPAPGYVDIEVLLGFLLRHPTVHEVLQHQVHIVHSQGTIVEPYPQACDAGVEVCSRLQ